MSYTVPSVQISQEFTNVPVFTESPLSALVVGPHLPPVGYITAIAVSTAGLGYTTAPTVTITDAAGSGAAAVANINSSGAITSFTITQGGAAYSAPVITISAPPGTATGNVLTSGSAVTGISITNIGSGYVSAPAIIISGGGGTGATATATLTNGYVTGITITAGGTGYTSVPTVVFASPGTEIQAVAGSVTFTSSRAELTGNPLVGFIGSVSQPSDIINTFGDTAYQNTIAYGLLQAVNNSNGSPVYYCVTTPVSGGVTEEDAYDIALNLAQKSSSYYGLVPLTFNTTVQQDVTAHVNAMSAPGNAKWRVCWLSNPISGSGNTASQIAGYLASLLSSTISEGSSGNPNSGPRRVRNVFPPTYTDGNGTTVNGYFAAAALAGLRSGSVPHQSLTNTQVIGPVAVPLVTQTYSNTQLNQLAAAGVWILTQDATGGSVYTRQQLTGDSTTLNYREDSVTTNVDSISYALQSALAPFVGIYNISPASILQVKTAVDTELNYLLTNTYTPRAGNQLLSYTIVSIAQDPTFADRINVTVSLSVPYPMNNIVVTLSI